MTGIVHKSALDLENLVHLMKHNKADVVDVMMTLDQIKRDLWYVARHVDPLIERMERGEDIWKNSDRKQRASAE